MRPIHSVNSEDFLISNCCIQQNMSFENSYIVIHGFITECFNFSWDITFLALSKFEVLKPNVPYPQKVWLEVSKIAGTYFSLTILSNPEDARYFLFFFRPLVNKHNRLLIHETEAIFHLQQQLKQVLIRIRLSLITSKLGRDEIVISHYEVFPQVCASTDLLWEMTFVVINITILRHFDGCKGCCR